MASNWVYSCLATLVFCGVTVNWLPGSAVMVGSWQIAIQILIVVFDCIYRYLWSYQHNGMSHLKRPIKFRYYQRFKDCLIFRLLRTSSGMFISQSVTAENYFQVQDIRSLRDWEDLDCGLLIYDAVYSGVGKRRFGETHSHNLQNFTSNTILLFGWLLSFELWITPKEYSVAWCCVAPDIWREGVRTSVDMSVKMFGLVKGIWICKFQNTLQTCNSVEGYPMVVFITKCRTRIWCWWHHLVMTICSVMQLLMVNIFRRINYYY